MAEFPAPLDSIFGIATSQGAASWLNLGINIILSTIVGGLILVLILGVLGREWGERVKVGNAFIVVLIINIINLFGVIGFISPYISTFVIILPLVIWILLIKAFFGELSFLHAIIVGLIGFAVSIIAIPYLVSMVLNYIPISF